MEKDKCQFMAVLVCSFLCVVDGRQKFVKHPDEPAELRRITILPSGEKQTEHITWVNKLVSI